MTNFYLFKENGNEVGAIYNTDNQYIENRNINKNLVMLTDENTRNFTFIIKASNFFNREVDNNKISDILNILKSVYTKYSLNIDTYSEPHTFENYIYLNQDNTEFLLANDEDWIMY
jgi:hypothetical protein